MQLSYKLCEAQFSFYMVVFHDLYDYARINSQTNDMDGWKDYFKMKKMIYNINLRIAACVMVMIQ